MAKSRNNMQWNPAAGVLPGRIFSNPKTPGINSLGDRMGGGGGEPPPLPVRPPTEPTPYNRQGYLGRPGWGLPPVPTTHVYGSQYGVPMSGQGITAGGRNVPGGGSSPLTNVGGPRQTGMQILKEQYKAYAEGITEGQAPTFEQWMQARFNAFNAMRGSSNIHYYNVEEFNEFFQNELALLTNTDQAGIQQMPMWGYSNMINQRY